MALNLIISRIVAEKLFKKHYVTIEEVEECFLNRNKGLLEDKREKNKTNPPTLWFIAETDQGRLLKIIFIELQNGTYEIKTAYEPNDNEVKIYEKYS
ncbi:MAG: uncharacterized protein K0S27_1517 [Gammaproteobacteria bacterium]|jgi:uncharacterized DUF497 family protein|nr:uncharacterized protein [Gammaproteobacteria bacterium]